MLSEGGFAGWKFGQTCIPVSLTRDLSTLADCDTDKSIDAASKLVCRLYDQKGKLKEDDVDLNKLRVRLAAQGCMFGQTSTL
jgi:hypothetical protein